ncbi:MAG: hypothetical protein ACFFEA_08615, partial [Candidatus Thorarchaeota archaeon]
MTIDESEPKAIAKWNRYHYLYAAIFMTATVVATVMLSIGGYISLDPLTALFASMFAGFAFLLVQTTYVRFVANTS